jgi:hypothetical protein
LAKLNQPPRRHDRIPSLQRGYVGQVRRLIVSMVVGLSALAAGCGGSSGSGSTAGSPGATVASAQCEASSSSESGASSASPAVGNCTFVVSDGRRFRCSSGHYSLERGNPTPQQLTRARGCARLSPLHLTAATRALIASVARVKSCLQKHGVRALGGAVLQSAAQVAAGPQGEVIAGSADHGAFIAFYDDPALAQRAAVKLRSGTRRLHARVQRDGALTIVWIAAPAGVVSGVGTRTRA